MNIDQRLAALGLRVPEIILPAGSISLEKWAVIACDQFTQDRDYWQQVEQAVAGSPSALRLIFPEVYLEDAGREARVREIHQTMEAYLEDGTLGPSRRGCVYVERAVPGKSRRRGLLAAIDLEQYDWRPASRPLIRATEGTVPERLPPRMEIRRGAPLELPHILILIDDEGDALLPALGARAKAAPPLYEGPLMPGAGSVAGWALDGEADLAFLAGALEDLARRANARYGQADGAPFLFAVGDGNHSLAAAKAVWEEYKAAHQGEPGLMNRRARWALAEIENLYDPGIVFEPIHRLLFGADMREVLPALEALPGFTCRALGQGADAREELLRLVERQGDAGNRLGLIAGSGLIFAEFAAPGLAADRLQPLLDGLVKAEAIRGMDYIHGAEALFHLVSASSGNAGVLLPPVRKSGLFETVARSGPLPRKSFSMGDAREKRFYLECRRLFG